MMMMMMMGIPHEMFWCIVCHLCPADVIACRMTCWSWRMMLDAVPQRQWEQFYRLSVCSVLNVGPSFDWQRAVAYAARTSDTIKVLCVWKGISVRMAVPWTKSSNVHAHFDECARAVVDQYLYPGIRRSQCITPHDLDFIYHDAFRLRMRSRSCIHRNSIPACYNCETRSKRRCLELRCEYFIRSLDNIPEERVDELLARYIRPTAS